MKYIKKPIEVEAFQFNASLISKTENNIDNRPDWIKGKIQKNLLDGYYIQTLEGRMKVNDGDYIIKGIKDEIYPCRKDIFLESYDLIDDKK